MELESSYQLLGVLRDDGIRTFRAIEIATGQALQVHLFARPDSEPDRILFKALRALPVSRRRELLDIGTEGDQPYIVTETLPESVAARDWLTRLAGLPQGTTMGPVTLAGSWKTGTPIPDEVLRLSHASPPPKLPPPPARPAELAPDFTRVMRLDAFSAIPNAASPLSAPQPNEEPDDLDRMFGGPPSTAPPPLPPPPPLPQPPPPQSQSARKDDFDWILGSQPQPVAPPAPPPASKPPGDFTKMFSVPAAESAPVPEGSKTPGDFTGTFFGTPTAETPRAAFSEAPPDTPTASLPSKAAKQSGEFTAAFFSIPPAEAAPPVDKPPQSAPAPQPAQAQPAPTQPTPTQPTPAAPDGSLGDFTKVFFAGQPPQPPPPVIPQPPATPPVQNEPPGDMTKVFFAGEPPVSAAPVAPQPSAAPPPSGDAPGDFTKVFFAGQPAKPATPLVQQPALPPQPDKAPGEFTMMFQAPAQTSDKPPGEFTGRFRAGPVQQSAPPQQTLPVAAKTNDLASSPVRPESAPQAEEATRLFQPGSFQSLDAAANAAPPPPALPSRQQLPAQVPPVQPSPDEATRLFQPAAPPATPPGLAAFPPPSHEPGEFTRSFGTPIAPRSDALAAPPLSTPGQANAEGPSEFTRFFESPIAPQSGGHQAGNSNLPLASQGPPVVQTPRPGHQPGEFTQMFGPRTPPSSASSAPPASFGSDNPMPLGSGPMGSATGAFAMPKAPSLAPPSASMSSGDYTRMMSAGSAAPTLGQPQAGAPAAAAPSKSKLPLYIIGGAVLLAIILIVVFFLFK